MLFKNENLTELSSKREGGLRSSEVASTRAPAPAPRVFLVVQVVVQYFTSQFSPELSPPRLRTAVDPPHRLLSRHAVMPLNQLWLHTEGIGDNYDEAIGDVGENRGLGHDDYNARITLPVFIHI